MSLAADARAAVHERPFLLEALRAGIVNYAAAARAIDVGDDEEAVATALRRYADRLPDRAIASRRTNVRMQSGFGRVNPPVEDSLLTVAGDAFAPGTGDHTVVSATGEVDPVALGHALGRLGSAGIVPVAAGVAGEALCIVVERSDGPRALQTVEDALEAVPDPTV